MSIPIDGKIKKFHSQIIKRGFKYDKYLTKGLSDSRIYWGYFAGVKSKLHVGFDPNTKVVNSCAVFIRYESEEGAINKYKELVKRIEEKYGNDPTVKFFTDSDKNNDNNHFQWKKVNYTDEYESTNFTIPFMGPPFIVGSINISVTKFIPQDLSKIIYSVCLIYYDYINSQDSRHNSDDDL